MHLVCPLLFRGFWANPTEEPFSICSCHFPRLLGLSGFLFFSALTIFLFVLSSLRPLTNHIRIRRFTAAAAHTHSYIERPQVIPNKDVLHPTLMRIFFCTTIVIPGPLLPLFRLTRLKMLVFFCSFILQNYIRSSALDPYCLHALLVRFPYAV